MVSVPIFSFDFGCFVVVYKMQTKPMTSNASVLVIESTATTILIFNRFMLTLSIKFMPFFSALNGKLLIFKYVNKLWSSTIASSWLFVCWFCLSKFDFDFFQDFFFVVRRPKDSWDSFETLRKISVQSVKSLLGADRQNRGPEFIFLQRIHEMLFTQSYESYYRFDHIPLYTQTHRISYTKLN